MSSSALKNHNSLYRSSIAISISLPLANYFVWVWGAPPAWLLMVIICVSGTIVLGAVGLKKDWLLLGILLYLVVVSLSNPNVGWDPRSLWFFHAKRIFLEGGLYTRLEHYYPNPYPSLFSAFAASLASFHGVWTEQVPKLSSLFFLMPVFLLIRQVSRSSTLTWLWFLLLLLVAGIKLINGYQDPLLGLYLVIYIFLMNETNLNKPSNQLDWSSVFVLLSLLGVMLSLPLLKNEGLAMLLTLVLASYIAQRRLHLTLWVFTGLSIAMWWLTWQQQLNITGVKDGLMSGGISGIFERVSDRVLQVRPVIEVAVAMAEKSLGWLLAYWVAWRWANRRGANRRGAKDESLVSNFMHQTLLWWALLYSGILFVIYVSTPADLTWHLNTSVGRTMMPLNIALSTFTLFLLRDKILAWFGTTSAVPAIVKPKQ